MFSIDETFEPLSSNFVCPNSNLEINIVNSEQETKSDERNSDAIEPVESPPTPNFSIRAYVYESRSKNIEASWPFNPKFLKLCVKNGVKQILPPFEPPDIIKTRSINPVLSTYNVLNQGDNNSNNNNSNNNNSISDENIPSDTENLPLVVIKDKKRKNKALNKVKKVKISLEVEKFSNLDHQIGSHNNLITDPMASKICPVCKIFSSSSNTTLNAHIDQCLSMDSNPKNVENDILKPKIKPRKKKLLSEVYETALSYTLEDLDRRNGTNWALNGVMGANNEDPKPDNLKPNKGLKVDNNQETCREREEREGAVYMDSNGIKIRILSKFEDLKEPVRVLKEEKIKKLSKGKIGKKKIGVGVKKMKVEGSKKFKPFKGLKTRVQPPRDGKASETQNKNGIINEKMDLLINIPKEPAKCNNNNNIIHLTNWVCAKRSDTPKKRNNKNPYKITNNVVLDDYSPSTSGQIQKFPNSKFSNSKSSNSPNTLRLKLPKLPNSKGGEANCNNITEMGSKSGNLCNKSLGKLQNGPNLRSESIETQVPLSRKFKKHRSILKPSKKSGTFASKSYNSSRVLNEELLNEDIITHANKRLKFTECNNNSNNDDIIFEDREEEFARDCEEITESTRGQDENIHNEETHLENIIEPSKYPEFLFPTNNENSEDINESFEGINEISEDINDPQLEPLIAPQIDNNHDNDNNNNDYDNNNNDNDYDNNDDSDDNTSLDTPQDDSSITSNIWDEEMNLERNLDSFGDINSESPNSTMSLSSKEPFFTQPDPLTKGSNSPLKITERSEEVEEITDKPFVCSCRENLSKEGKSVILQKEKQLPSLYIGPRDSPSQCFSTLSQSQSPVPVLSPNPVLRLMGKNLLVVNQEEITIPPLTPSSNNSSSSSMSRTGHFMPPHNGFLNQQNFPYQLSQSMHNNNPYQLPFNRQVAVPPYVPKEVILIDDSPEMDRVPVPVPQQNISLLGPPMMQQRPFFCYPAQNGTTGAVIYPQVGTGYFTQVGSSGVHEPGAFIFRPPSSGYLDPSLYYSHTMR